MISMYLVDRRRHGRASRVSAGIRPRRMPAIRRVRSSTDSAARPQRLNRRLVEIAQRRIVLRQRERLGDGGQILGVEGIVGEERLQQLARARA